MKHIRKFKDEYPKSDSKRKLKSARPKAKLIPEMRGQKGKFRYLNEY